MENGIQPVMNVGSGYGNCGYGFGGDGIWLFALLILFGMGGFGFSGNRNFANDCRCATVEDLNNSANFTRLESQVMNNGNSAQQIASNIYNGICSLGYENSQNFGALSKQVSECCCNNLRALDNVRFDMANYTASINANTTAGIQKVLDKICADNEKALQSRISQLELQQAMCGVLRVPQNFSYAVGTPFNVGCGCNNGCNGFNGNI